MILDAKAVRRKPSTPRHRSPFRPTDNHLNRDRVPRSGTAEAKSRSVAGRTRQPSPIPDHGGRLRPTARRIPSRFQAIPVAAMSPHRRPEPQIRRAEGKTEFRSRLGRYVRPTVNRTRQPTRVAILPKDLATAWLPFCCHFESSKGHRRVVISAPDVFGHAHYDCTSGRLSTTSTT